MKKIPTPHITASKSDIAKTVIMPGDPLRAKFIAENYLESFVEVNSIRNMLAYTGFYKGKKVTVMGSGMGMPSMGIYSYELYEFYDVENIIRIGSAGGYSEELNIYDVVLATSAHTMSNYAKMAFNIDENELKSSSKLNDLLKSSAEKLGIDIYNGKIETSDVFYKTTHAQYRSLLEKENCIASEMEAFALFANARQTGKNAACILTIVDHMKKKQNTPAKKRENGLVKMIEIALNADY